jgi:hypothetical protein
MSTDLALTEEHAARLWFEEEMDMLRILRDRIFRAAIQHGAELPDMPDMGDTTIDWPHE